jgi:hypothetical protein
MRGTNNLISGRADDRAARHPSQWIASTGQLDRHLASNGHPLEMNHAKRARTPVGGSEVPSNLT